MWIIRMLLILILVIAVTGFAMLNSSERATVTLGTENLTFYDVPLVVLLFEAFVFGAVVWFFVTVFHEIKLRQVIRSQRRQIGDLHEEIGGLRDISLEGLEDEEPPLDDIDI